MAELVSCQTYTNECPLCGRSKNQTNFCTQEVIIEAGRFSYMIDHRELRSAGPHVL